LPPVKSAGGGEDLGMLEAAVSALNQMVSRPFRLVLLKAVALAAVLLIAVGIGLDRMLAVLLDRAGIWMETAVGPKAHAIVTIFEWLLAVAAGVGIFAGVLFLMPAVTALVASFFVDSIAEQVEQLHYPEDPPGSTLPIAEAILEGVQAALLAIVIYVCAVPFLLIGGLGFVIFFFATAYVQGRIYFELAAMRFHPRYEAKMLRRMNSGTVFLAGLLIAAFVSIPIVSLATPLFGTALMVHVHKRVMKQAMYGW
jgi:CysZ protein